MTNLRRRHRAVWGVVWAACAVVAIASDASGRTLPVAGDDGHLWIVQPGPAVESAEGDEDDKRVDTVNVYHRNQSDTDNQLLEVESLRGRVRKRGVAAAGRSLWLAYRDRSVQRIDASPSPLAPGWAYTAEMETPLPRGELRAMTAGADRLWVLMRLPQEAATEPTAAAQHPGTEAEAEAESASRREARRRLLLGLPPGRPRAEPSQTENQPPQVHAVDESDEAEQDEQAKTAVDGEAGATDPVSVTDVLLVLRRGQWVPTSLPDDWRQGASVSLVPTDGGPPTLVVYPQQSGEQVTVYRWRDDAWQSTAYQWEGDGSLAGEAIQVQGQLVVCRTLPQAQPVRVALSVLRGGQIRPVGELAVDAAPGSRWGVVPVGLTVALIVQDGGETADDADPDSDTGDAVHPLNLRWARMDLSGHIAAEPAALVLRPESPWVNAADYVVMAAIAILTLLMLVVFWRRDPTRHQLALPPNLRLADLSRRAVAGLIDLLPGLLIVLRAYDLGLLELLQFHWPGSVPTFEGTLPGLLVIGVFVAHTTASEMVTGRTLGKALMGLRVTGLNGDRPKWWQLLVRGLLKTFDLVAWLLLVLPMLGPYRQRLGDLLARTVVVTPQSEEEAADDPDEEESDD